MSIKNLSIRAKKKNKTKGRPSKEEVIISEIMSYYFDKPEMQRIRREVILESIIYG